MPDLEPESVFLPMVPVSVETADALAEIASASGQTASWVIRRVLEEYVSDLGRENAPGDVALTVMVGPGTADDLTTAALVMERPRADIIRDGLAMHLRVLYCRGDGGCVICCDRPGSHGQLPAGS